jgi:hypothetical protein
MGNNHMIMSAFWLSFGSIVSIMHLLADYTQLITCYYLFLFESGHVTEVCITLSVLLIFSLVIMLFCIHVAFFILFFLFILLYNLCLEHL